MIHGPIYKRLMTFTLTCTVPVYIAQKLSHVSVYSPLGECYVLPNWHTTSQPDLTAYTATALYHAWKNTTKSSAPEDGHKVARNMLSNL